MDENKYLIILKGDDKTSSVKNTPVWNESKKGYTIVFNDEKNKNKQNEYMYSKENCIFLQNPINVDIEKDFQFFLFKKNIKKVLRFGDYYKIFWKERNYGEIKKSITKLIKYDDPSLFALLNNKQLNKTQKIFNYLMDVSEFLIMDDEKNRETLSKSADNDLEKNDGNYSDGDPRKEGIKLVHDLFEQITEVNENTCFFDYLNGSFENEGRDDDNIYPIIFPFSTNKSQIKAVTNALNSKVSIIEGPPGTGKTQTILNIIANLLIRNKTVAVVSNNNSAIENVIEKFSENELKLDALCAKLGNSKNKKLFFENQETASYPQTWENMLNESFNNDETKNKLMKLEQKIIKLYGFENQKAVLKQKLRDLETEFWWFKQKYELEDLNQFQKFINNKKSKKLFKIFNLLWKTKSISWWLKFKLVFFKHFGNFDFFKQDISKLILFLEHFFYVNKMKEINHKINLLDSKLKNSGKSEKISLFTKYSSEFLKHYLLNKYNINQVRKKFTNDDLKTKVNEFFEEYPIVFSTTFSIRYSPNPKYVYDYLIMDEASQVDLCTGLLSLTMTKNIVVVGDTKQLKNIIQDETKKRINELTKINKIPDEYNYCKKSFLFSAIEVFRNAPKVLLKEHYRCEPKIIEFCNEMFYDNQLCILSKDKDNDNTIKTITTKVTNADKMSQNTAEFTEIMKILNEFSDSKNNNGSMGMDIGIISPFRKQVQFLRENIERISNYVNKSDIATVHKFQGREKDNILISIASDEDNQFIENPQLLNVAISRAKKSLTVILSKNISTNKNILGNLVKYTKYNMLDNDNNRGNNVIIFSNLYDISNYSSTMWITENKIYQSLNNVILKNNFALNIAVNYPISKILDFSDYNVNRNIKKHHELWNLVVYEKMNKHPILVIELETANLTSKTSNQVKQKNLYINQISYLTLNKKKSDFEAEIENYLAKLGYVKQNNEFV